MVAHDGAHGGAHDGAHDGAHGVIARRALLEAAGLALCSRPFWSVLCLAGRARAWQETRPAAAEADRDALRRGLDGLGRAAEGDYFTDGHQAAAVLAATFFCRENRLEQPVREAVQAHVAKRLLPRPVPAPFPAESADPELLTGLVRGLDAGIRTLRRGGHNVIFAALALKAFREVPEAVTPARVAGIRQLLARFAVERVALGDPASFAGADLDDSKKFTRFILEEYLRALDLYVQGKGHHGFAGHVLTFGHALLELFQLGHRETARKGLDAYRQFVQQARNGARLRPPQLVDPGPRSRSPLEQGYWAALARRPSENGIVDSHLVKYPYSFHALLRDAPDDELKERALKRVHELTAVS